MLHRRRLGPFVTLRNFWDPKRMLGIMALKIRIKRIIMVVIIWKGNVFENCRFQNVYRGSS
jgi:hypothetical protein